MFFYLYEGMYVRVHQTTYSNHTSWIILFPWNFLSHCTFWMTTYHHSSICCNKMELGVWCRGKRKFCARKWNNKTEHKMLLALKLKYFPLIYTYVRVTPQTLIEGATESTVLVVLAWQFKFEKRSMHHLKTLIILDADEFLRIF